MKEKRYMVKHSELAGWLSVRAGLLSEVLANLKLLGFEINTFQEEEL